MYISPPILLRGNASAHASRKYKKWEKDFPWVEYGDKYQVRYAKSQYLLGLKPHKEVVVNG